MKVNPIDRFLRDLVDKYFFEIALAVLVLVSVLIRIYLAKFRFNGEYISGDYQNYLRHWVEVYREKGLIEGLSRNVGDYYVPYNILLGIIGILPIDDGLAISFISCLGEYLGAFFAFKVLDLLIREKGGKAAGYSKRAAFSAVMLLFIPICILNGTIWKQCDGWYTSFIWMGLFFFFSKKYTKAFFLFSLAFVFKLQTLFFAPFLVLAYLLFFDFSILEFLWFPGMYLLAGIPAILCGRPVIRTYLTYIKQTDIYKMTIGFPNVYCLGLDSYEVMAKPAILITISALIFIACLTKAKVKNADNKILFLLAGFMDMTCVMFLPAMHERYDYAAIILISAYALAFDLRMGVTAVLMIVCSMLNYGCYLFHGGEHLISYQAEALLYLLGYLYGGYYIFARLGGSLAKK